MSFSQSISGITSALFRQSVSANDLSNVNTSGFKEGRVSQSSSEAGGTRVDGVSTNQRQGPLIATGRSTDLAIEGDGFFVMEKGGERVFSRTGSLNVDGDGNVVNTVTGGVVQGKPADAPPGTVDDLTVSGSARRSPAKATDQITFSGNLNAKLETGESVSSSTDVFTSNGGTRTLTTAFEKTATNEFQVTAEDSSTGETALKGTLEFGSNGTLQSTDIKQSPNAPESFQGLFLSGKNGSDPVEVTAGNLDFSGVVQQAGESSVEVSDISGRREGELESVSFSNGGELVASFDNGSRRTLGTVAVARFDNPGGLQQEGGQFRPTANSGDPRLGTAGQGGRGTIRSGFLEASNTSLAKELVGQISNQHALSANVATLETKDEMLGEVLDLAG